LHRAPHVRGKQGWHRATITRTLKPEDIQLFAIRVMTGGNLSFEHLRSLLAQVPKTVS
jgi:hypothetical protein